MEGFEEKLKSIFGKIIGDQKLISKEGVLLCHGPKNDSERPFSCNQCEKSFKNISHLKRHLKVHTDERPFKCLQCGKLFREASQLKKHETYSCQRSFSCSHCDVKVTSKQLLNDHKRLEHAIYCEECKTTFSDRSSLRRHIRIHTGEQPIHYSHNSLKCYHQQ